MNSLKTVLNLYKRDCITQEEAISLIEDLYSKHIYPYWKETYTYSNDAFKPPFEVTSVHNKK